MSCSKPKPNGTGAFRSSLIDRAQSESLHGPNVSGGRITGDHIHYHKDGATVTKNGSKYTMSQKYCAYCQSTVSHKTEDRVIWRCTKCGGTTG